MGNLTRNLSRAELACKCGCGQDTVDFDLVQGLQETCDHWALRRGIPKVVLYILSGNRCPEHNAKSGGEKSQHLLGKAADFRIDGINSRDVFKYLEKRYNGRYGLGLYGWGVHLDVRSGGPARW